MYVCVFYISFCIYDIIGMRRVATNIELQFVVITNISGNIN